MDRVGVRELRQNLSVYLRRVARGESLEVTERGRPRLPTTQ
jgi:prevent-host-death family protein